jgi:hypothetical protein
MPAGRSEGPVQARVHRIGYLLVPQHQPDADCSLGLCPVRDNLIHRGIGGIDRFHDAKPFWILRVAFERVARVIAVEVEAGDDNRAIDTDRVHGRHHLLAIRRLRAM